MTVLRQATLNPPLPKELENTGFARVILNTKDADWVVRNLGGDPERRAFPLGLLRSRMLMVKPFVDYDRTTRSQRADDCLSLWNQSRVFSVVPSSLLESMGISGRTTHIEIKGLYRMFPRQIAALGLDEALNSSPEKIPALTLPPLVAEALGHEPAHKLDAPRKSAAA